MFKKFVALFCLALFCLSAAGCGGGGDSNTNGQLALTSVAVSDLTQGLFSVDVSATYTNAAHSGGLQGFPITISMTAYNRSGTVIGLPKVDRLSADSSGVVNDHLRVTQTNDVIFVDVTAASGGLSDTRTVAVPSNVAMTSSPSIVAFAAAALAGTTQTVTISGGLSPYSAHIDAGHVTDIAVSAINGNSIILTKLKNSVTNGPTLSATLTVSDSSGATPIQIPVSYN